MPKHGDLLTSNESVISYPDQDWTAFRDAHPCWVNEQQDEDGVIYCLNPVHIDESLRLFRLNANVETAEREFAKLCDRHQAIGVSSDQFIKYSLLRPLVPWPKDHDLTDFLDLGWTQADTACVRSLSDPTAKINQRLKAAAGRLISTPNFITAKADLRLTWEKLPTRFRPPLPIARSFKSAELSGPDLKSSPKDLVEFIVEFDKFCDEWHLLGLTTWHLPDVRGPQWVPELAPDDMRRRGVMAVETPWHFPVLGEDGLGRLLEDEHRRQAAERGVDDEGSWDAYARMFEVYHWQNVVRKRYGAAQRVRAFVTKMEAMMAEMFGLSCERVQFHRKRLRALQSGSLESLHGLR